MTMIKEIKPTDQPQREGMRMPVLLHPAEVHAHRLIVGTMRSGMGLFHIQNNGGK